MTNELFKEHHPHTLGDYMARGMVGFSRSIVSAIFKHGFANKAIIANTVLSSLAMILANRLHHRTIRRGEPDRESIEDLLCEASGTHFHIIVTRSLVTLTRLERIMLSIIQCVSICFFRLIACLSPRTSHRSLGYMYESSITEYSNWIDAIEDGDVVNAPAHPMAIKYWDLKTGSTLSTVLAAMRDDIAKFRDYEHARAEIHNIKKSA